MARSGRSGPPLPPPPPSSSSYTNLGWIWAPATSAATPTRWSSARTAPSATSWPPLPTYLPQQKQDRAGTVSLFSVDAGAEDVSRRLRLLHTVETAGVFDMKWSLAAPLLAQADAHGCLALWRLEQEDGSDKDVCVEDISSSMCLYVDWNQTAESLSVGLSDGSLSVVSMRGDCLEVSEQWTAHQYEVWTCYFDRARPHLLYSGSDDCSFSCWDLRESPSNVVFQCMLSYTTT